MAKPAITLPPEPSRVVFDKMEDELNKIGREPRASVLIWHVHLEYLLDWLIRKKLKKPEELLKELNFYHKIILVNTFDILPETTITHLFRINTIRNHHAHRMDVGTPYFNDLCRDEIKSLDWFTKSSMQARKTTYNLFSELANETYHELHKLYFRL